MNGVPSADYGMKRVDLYNEAIKSLPTYFSYCNKIKECNFI